MPPAPQLTASPELLFLLSPPLSALVIWQLTLTPHPSLCHQAFAMQGQPSVLCTTGALQHRHRELTTGRASVQGPPGPGPSVRLTCQASWPHVMQLAR